MALVGPRQSGKTTLARSFPGAYFDLEQEAERLRLDVQWDGLVEGKKLLILDEAQACPQVFPRLRGAIDSARNRKGRFLLLGSVSPALMTHVSESLAGRLAIVELTPFLLGEAGAALADSLWLYGGYPEGGILDAGQFPVWQKSYLDLLAQRDLPNWGLPAKAQLTERLLKMLAAVHGQLWNASQIGQSLGLSHTTVNSYLDYLEGAFLIRRLMPYAANLKKRLTRSHRCYWRDSGLLHALLSVHGYDDLLSKPWVGASWEGFVIEQILGVVRNLDRPFEYGFLRTSDQYEIDLVLDFGNRKWAIEIKLTTDPSSSDFQRFMKASDLIKADKRIFLSRTADSWEDDKAVSCSLPWLLERLTSGKFAVR